LNALPKLWHRPAALMAGAKDRVIIVQDDLGRTYRKLDCL
jgi:hypothetical protein